MKKNDKLVFLYEDNQIDLVLKKFGADSIVSGDYTLVSLDYRLEIELKKRNLPFQSINEYIDKDRDSTPLLLFIEKLSHQWYEAKEFSFFKYHDFALGEFYEVAFQFYLERILYYVDIFSQISFGDVKEIWVVETQLVTPSSAGPFAILESSVVIDVLKMLCEQKSIYVKVIGARQSHRAMVLPKQWFVKYILKILNIFVGLVSSKKPLKIFISDYWWHVEPFIEKMDNVELVFMEQSEFKNISWKNIFKYRVRFMHSKNYVSGREKRSTKLAQKNFVESWKVFSKNTDLQKMFVYNGISFWSLVDIGIMRMMDYSQRVMADMHGLENIFKKTHINRVLLRATISGQHHFLLAAKLAMNMQIPAIELQHANEILEPSSVFSKLGSEYLAGYGKLTRDAYVRNHAYESYRIVPVGSPRFDQYINEESFGKKEGLIKKLSLDPKKPIVVFIVPPIISGLYRVHFNSYEFMGLIEDLKRVQDAIPEIQVVFKLRPTYGKYKFYYEMIESVFKENFAIVSDEDAQTVLRMANVVISGNSTMMLEAMVLRKPLILWALKASDVELPKVFGVVVPCAHTAGDLISLLSALVKNPSESNLWINRTDSFMKEQYLFDGKSSERIVQLINNPPQK